MVEAGRPKRQVFEVDDVQIGFLADFEGAPVVQSKEASRLATLLLHNPLEFEFLPPRTIPCPVRQQEGGNRRVADHSTVRPPVREPRNTVRVRELLANRLAIPRCVVEDRHQQHRSAVLLEKEIVEKLERIDAARFGHRRHRLVIGGLVIRRVAEHVDLVERLPHDEGHAVEDVSLLGRQIVFGEDRRLHFGFPEPRGEFFEGGGLLLERLEGRALREGVIGLQADQESEGPTGNLRS